MYEEEYPPTDGGYVNGGSYAGSPPDTVHDGHAEGGGTHETGAPSGRAKSRHSKAQPRQQN